MHPFDKALKDFEIDLRLALNWKHEYLGAAYRTRLRQAIAALRTACDRMETALEKDSKNDSADSTN